MRSKTTLTASRAAELLRYEDGHLFWRDPNGRSPGSLGSPAGRAGRLQVWVDGRAYYVHRLVWLLHHGAWPERQIDHINGNVLDNRIENLRDATPTENSQNRQHRGTSYDSRSGKWRARIMVNGRSTNLGAFQSEADARRAYVTAKLEVHEAWATGRGVMA